MAEKYMKLYNVISNKDSHLQIKESIDNMRADLYSYDSSLLQSTDIKLTFGEFKNIPNGRFIITHHNIEFNCLFKREDKSDNLYVIFSGARPIGHTEPVFKRWSYYKFFNGHMLNIDDPMYKAYKGLHCGWYYGNTQESYCDYIVEIIEEFVKQNNIKNIILFSSSAGGFAALYCACKIPGSIAVAINPQIKLNLDPYSQDFYQITNINLQKRDKFGRNHLDKMIKAASNSRFLIIENLASDIDMLQFRELCLELNAQGRYGLSQLSPNILSWIYEAVLDSRTPHNAQEFPPIFFAIEFLISHFDTAMEYKEIYLILSELWNNHFNLVSQNQKTKK